MKPIIAVHHHEIGLKGKNRGYFEKHLLRNVRLTLKGLLPQNAVTGGFGRFIIYTDSNQQATDEIILRLKKVFGLSNICFGFETGQTIEDFNSIAESLLNNKSFSTICVKTSRANKAYPKTSVEVNKEVGAFLCTRFNVRANLSQPDETIYIEIVDKLAYVYLSKIPGAGGLPAGISGRVVSLISAGFDSPVASYKIMKRGAYVVYVHFHSYPFVSHNSIDQVKKILELLTQYQYFSKLYLVPFAECQQDIVLKTPQPLRVILYRRMMVRVAERIALNEKANALVTGESLGQVASQTLRNIRVVNNVAKLPILRPLVGSDKEEIIDVARKIETYDICKEPYDDCCSFLTPRNPETWADPAAIADAETQFDVNDWIEKLLEKTEKTEFKFPD
ncbi:MAG: tRNA uracil 4-sulfurtransferase ThiI [Bacteroidota bacterium]|nr:tRNA uracil 4-sulfurtransferase ThiI [Bacteroidota bacterium]